MPYIKKLIGDRLYLAPVDLSEESITKFATCLNNPAISDYLGRTGQVISELSVRTLLESLAKDTKGRNFFIVEKSKDNLIGLVSLEQINPIRRNATLGIYIGETELQSHGYGTEAINLILEYGFRYLNLHSIRLTVMSENRRALRCYEKCGFQQNGLSRAYFYVNGKYYDGLHLDLLDSEFTGDYIRNKAL